MIKKKRREWLYKEIHPILVVVVTIIAIFVGAAFFVLIFEMNYAYKATHDAYRVVRVPMQQAKPSVAPTSQY